MYLNYSSLRNINTNVFIEEIPKVALVGAVIATYFLAQYLNIGGIGQLLSNITGFVIPAYYSLLAIESTTSLDDTVLLTYWVVFSLLNIIEFFSKTLTSWFPFYWCFKSVFLLYLGLPQFGGSLVVYKHLIRPISLKFIVPHAESTADVAGESSHEKST